MGESQEKIAPIYKIDHLSILCFFAIVSQNCLSKSINCKFRTNKISNLLLDLIEMSKTQNLLPFIIPHYKWDGVRKRFTNEQIYAAYIPYESHDAEILDIAETTGLISEYLKLGVDREDYQPSYAYSFGDGAHEIGFQGSDLTKVMETIEEIQNRLEEKGCLIQRGEPIIKQIILS